MTDSKVDGAYTSLGRARMIVRVVMSRATRVLAVSFVLSTLFRHPTTYRGPLLAFTMTAKHALSQRTSMSGVHMSCVDCSAWVMNGCQSWQHDI